MNEQCQAIYWSYAWRAGEQETLKALAEGQGRTFPNAQEAGRWLISDIPDTEVAPSQSSQVVEG